MSRVVLLLQAHADAAYEEWRVGSGGPELFGAYLKALRALSDEIAARVRR